MLLICLNHKLAMLDRQKMHLLMRLTVQLYGLKTLPEDFLQDGHCKMQVAFVLGDTQQMAHGAILTAMEQQQEEQPSLLQPQLTVFLFAMPIPQTTLYMVSLQELLTNI